MTSLINCQQLDLYRDEKLLCQNINVNCHAQQSWAILGSNGCGKSSFLLTLAGLLNLHDNIKINRQAQTTYTPAKLATMMAILVQNQEIAFPMTVQTCLAQAYYPQQRWWQTLSLQQTQHLQCLLDDFNLTNLAQQNIQRLSGGETQRVLLATSLAQNTPIILLDEPTNHLDLAQQIRTLHYLKNLVEKHNKLLIMALHDVNLAYRFCTHALLFFPDKQCLAGPINDIITSDNLSRLYQHPVTAIEHQQGKMWLAQLS